MAARRYEISPRVLKNVFEREEMNFVSSSGHVMLYFIIRKDQSEMPNHFISMFFLLRKARTITALAGISPGKRNSEEALF